MKRYMRNLSDMRIFLDVLDFPYHVHSPYSVVKGSATEPTNDAHGMHALGTRI